MDRLRAYIDSKELSTYVVGVFSVMIIVWVFSQVSGAVSGVTDAKTERMTICQDVEQVKKDVLTNKAEIKENRLADATTKKETAQNISEVNNRLTSIETILNKIWENTEIKNGTNSN